MAVRSKSSNPANGISPPTLFRSYNEGIYYDITDYTQIIPLPYYFVRFWPRVSSLIDGWIYLAHRHFAFLNDAIASGKSYRVDGQQICKLINISRQAYWDHIHYSEMLTWLIRHNANEPSQYVQTPSGPNREAKEYQVVKTIPLIPAHQAWLRAWLQGAAPASDAGGLILALQSALDHARETNQWLPDFPPVVEVETTPRSLLYLVLRNLKDRNKDDRKIIDETLPALCQELHQSIGRPFAFTPAQQTGLCKWLKQRAPSRSPAAMAKALGQAIEAMKQGNPEVTRLFAARELPGDPLDTLITLAAKVLEAEVTSELKAQLLQPCRELLRRLNDSGPLTPGRLGFLQGWLCGALPTPDVVGLQSALNKAIAALQQGAMRFWNEYEVGSQSLREIALQAVACQPTPEQQVALSHLADTLYETLIPSNRNQVFLHHYFLREWLPRYGPGASWLVTLLETYTFKGTDNQPARDTTRWFNRGNADLANMLGVSQDSIDDYLSRHSDDPEDAWTIKDYVQVVGERKLASQAYSKQFRVARLAPLTGQHKRLYEEKAQRAGLEALGISGSGTPNGGGGENQENRKGRVNGETRRIEGKGEGRNQDRRAGASGGNRRKAEAGEGRNQDNGEQGVTGETRLKAQGGEGKNQATKPEEEGENRIFKSFNATPNSENQSSQPQQVMINHPPQSVIPGQRANSGSRQVEGEAMEEDDDQEWNLKELLRSCGIKAADVNSLLKTTLTAQTFVAMYLEKAVIPRVIVNFPGRVVAAEAREQFQTDPPPPRDDVYEALAKLGPRRMAEEIVAELNSARFVYWHRNRHWAMVTYARRLAKKISAGASDGQLEEETSRLLGQIIRELGLSSYRAKLEDKFQEFEAEAKAAYEAEQAANPDNESDDDTQSSGVQTKGMPPANEKNAVGNRAWQAALGELQLQLTKSTFDTWLRPTVFLDYQSGIFIIGVDHAYAKDWLENRLSSTVRRTLCGVTGQSVDVIFIVADHDLSADEISALVATADRAIDGQAPDHPERSEQLSLSETLDLPETHHDSAAVAATVQTTPDYVNRVVHVPVTAQEAWDLLVQYYVQLQGEKATVANCTLVDYDNGRFVLSAADELTQKLVMGLWKRSTQFKSTLQELASESTEIDVRLAAKHLQPSRRISENAGHRRVTVGQVWQEALALVGTAIAPDLIDYDENQRSLVVQGDPVSVQQLRQALAAATKQLLGIIEVPRAGSTDQPLP